MTVADDIRALAVQGENVAEIARMLGIRYQHAYGVLKRSGTLPHRSRETQAVRTTRTVQFVTNPPLSVDRLIRGGFAFAGQWTLTAEGSIGLDRTVPNAAGVYAFAMDGFVTYVGVATMGISKRLRFYAKPGRTQRTSQRLHHQIRSELVTRPSIDIYIAMPSNLEWNGLPVNCSAGLELGLIQAFALPWNIRSSGKLG